MRAIMITQPQVKEQQLSNDTQSTSTEGPSFPNITQHEGVVARYTPVKGYKSQGQRNSVYLPWPGPSFFGAIVISKSDTDLDRDASKTP